METYLLIGRHALRYVRACESLEIYATISTPIAIALRGCDFFESEESTSHTPCDIASKTKGF